MLDPKLTEKVVLVTGTNNPHGIGAAIAQAFGAQGAKVFLHYFRWTPGSGADSLSRADNSPGESFYYYQQTKSIDEVLERVRESGAQVAALEADLADPAAITKLFDGAEATLGPVEILVDNAACWEADTSSLPAPTCRISSWNCGRIARRASIRRCLIEYLPLIPARLP